MKAASTHRLIWGYFRLALGIIQIGAAVAGFFMLVSLGVTAETSVVILFGAAASLISHVVFGGESDPELGPETLGRNVRY